MPAARRNRSLMVLAGASLSLAATLSSSLPASAATLAITAMDCQPRRGAFLCTASVTGGTSPYTYTWNGKTTQGTEGSTSSIAVFSCPSGSTAVRTVTFTVTDSASSTASQSRQIDCRETWW